MGAMAFFELKKIGLKEPEKKSAQHEGLHFG